MSNAAVPMIAVQDLPEAVAPLDVREAGEWSAGHAPDAVHLPMSELPARLDEVPDDQDPLYVICRSGQRSAQVAGFLNEQGYRAVNVEGGMQAWRLAGRPMVCDGPDQPEVV